MIAVQDGSNAPNNFSVAHNVMDPVGVAHYRGALEYLGRIFSDPSGDNGNIYRFQLNAAGDTVTNGANGEALLSGFGATPLDLVALGVRRPAARDPSPPGN